MVEHQERVGPLTREVVVAAGREVLADVGLEELSLRKVAGRLGVTAPALYAHVEDKGDLIRAIGQLGIDALSKRLATINHPDPVERIRLQCREYAQNAIEDPQLHWVMCPQGARSSTAGRSFGSLLELVESLEVPAAAIQEAIDAKAIRGDLAPQLILLAIWTAAQSVATAVLVTSGLEDSVETLMSVVVDPVVDGLCISVG